MNNIAKLLLRRFSEFICHPAKQYHHAVPKSVTPTHSFNVANNGRIINLIQKTIIPLNHVVPKPAILDKPCFNIITKVDVSLPKKVDIEPTKEINDPVKNQEKKAHRMLIIRRRKMNKHKWRKWRRKNAAYFWRKERERSMKREINFRQEIHSKLKEAQNFSAEKYVAQKLEIYRKEILPDRINNVRMPAFAVREHLERLQAREKRKEEKLERRKKMIEERGSMLVDATK